MDCAKKPGLYFPVFYKRDKIPALTFLYTDHSGACPDLSCTDGKPGELVHTKSPDIRKSADVLLYRASLPDTCFGTDRSGYFRSPMDGYDTTKPGKCYT